MESFTIMLPAFDKAEHELVTAIKVDAGLFGTGFRVGMFGTAKRKVGTGKNKRNRFRNMGFLINGRIMIRGNKKPPFAFLF